MIGVAFKIWHHYKCFLFFGSWIWNFFFTNMGGYLLFVGNFIKYVLCENVPSIVIWLQQTGLHNEIIFLKIFTQKIFLQKAKTFLMEIMKFQSKFLSWQVSNIYTIVHIFVVAIMFQILWPLGFQRCILIWATYSEFQTTLY